MIIKTFVEPPIENNNYFIIDKQANEAVLIDCSSVDVVEKVRLLLKEHNAILKYILLTHGHFDHIAGISVLINSFRTAGIEPPKIVMHNMDLKIINSANQFLPMFGLPEISIPNVDLYIENNSILDFGTKKVKAIHTPGHTPGSVCYLIDNTLFSGDTIFRESVGRCDLEGGNFEQIVESINNKIFTLPEHINILPGHGSSTTVGWEKIHNQFA